MIHTTEGSYLMPSGIVYRPLVDEGRGIEDNYVEQVK